jgi:hypothetical protein
MAPWKIFRFLEDIFQTPADREDLGPIPSLQTKIPTSQATPPNIISLAPTLLDRGPQVDALVERLRALLPQDRPRKLLAIATGGYDDRLKYLFHRLEGIELHEEFPTQVVRLIADPYINWRDSAKAVISRLVGDLCASLSLPRSGDLSSLEGLAIGKLVVGYSDWTGAKEKVDALLSEFDRLTVGPRGFLFILLCLEGRTHDQKRMECEVCNYARALRDQDAERTWLLILEEAKKIERGHIAPWAFRLRQKMGAGPDFGHELERLEDLSHGNRPLFDGDGTPLGILEPHARRHVEEVCRKLGLTV